MAKILLAEDDKFIADLVVFKLTSAGHQVVHAHDGEEALRSAETDRPDLVLLDVMMPELSGFEVLQKLKEDPSLESIPIMMVTARSQEHDILTGLSAGAEDYIVKPFSIKELVARIELVLRRTRPSAARVGG